MEKVMEGHGIWKAQKSTNPDMAAATSCENTQ